MTEKMASQSNIKFSDCPVWVQVSEEGSGQGNEEHRALSAPLQVRQARDPQFVLEEVRSLEFYFRLGHSLAVGIQAWSFSSLGSSIPVYQMTRFEPDNLHGPFQPNALTSV